MCQGWAAKLFVGVLAWGLHSWVALRQHLKWNSLLLIPERVRLMLDVICILGGGIVQENRNNG